MSYSPLLGSSFNRTFLRDAAHPCTFSGMCAMCTADCIGSCEIGLSAVRGMEYRLPSCTASDAVSGDVVCDVEVKDPDGETAEVSGNGSIVPQKTGYYTATYSCTDEAGNVASRTLRILSKASVPVISVSAEDPDTLDVTVGEQVAIPAAEYVCSEGAVMVSSSVKVVRAGAASETVETEDGSFVPLAAGLYRVIYSATDYLGNEYTYELTYTAAEAEGAAVHGTLQHLLRLFDGTPVEMPEMKAFDYISSPGAGTAADVRIVITGETGESVTVGNGGVFTPSLQTFGDSVTIRYETACAGGSYAAAEEYTAEIYPVPDRDAEDYTDDGAYQLDDYLVLGDGMEVVYNGADEDMFFRVQTKEGETGDHSFTFANPLRADGFSVRFSVPASMKNFEQFVISLRDSDDASVGFDLVFEKIEEGHDFVRNAKTFVYANGKKYTVDGVYNTIGDDGRESVGNFTVSYIGGAVVDSSGEELFSITQNFDGGSWEGFPSGKVYATFSFRGVGNLTPSGEESSRGEVGTQAAMMITSLCGQAFFVDYDGDGNLTFRSNRVKLHHVALSGDPTQELSWRALLSFARHWGTYKAPLDKIEHQNCMLFELSYKPKRLGGWKFAAAFGADTGGYNGESYGGMLTISKSGIL